VRDGGDEAIDHGRARPGARAVVVAIVLVLLGGAALLASLIVGTPSHDAATRVDGPVVVFGGDVNLGRRQNALTAARGPDHALAGVPQLAAADLAVVNLESVVASVGAPAEKGEQGPYYFRGRPETLAVLTEAGVDVVATANNHSGDYGDEALLQQIRLLDRTNLAHAGSGRDLEGACAPTYRGVGDLRVALFSVDATMPHFAATDATPGTCYLDPDDATSWEGQMQPRITAARRTAHVVLVAVHAGGNFEVQPDSQEVALSRALVVAGADAVLGSSAHVLQGVELYRGRPIVYDAGNLLFDFQGADEVDAAVFSLVLGPHGVRQVRVSPVVGRYGTSRAVAGERAGDILDDFEDRSDAMGTDVRLEGGEAVVDIGDLPPRDPPSADLPRDRVQRPPAPADEPPGGCTVTEVPARARIEPQRVGPLTLVGAAVEPRAMSRRTMLWVETYWTLSSQAVAADLWVHQAAHPGVTTSMDTWRGDHEPCDWMWPTSRWSPGVIYRDRYGLRPPDELSTTDLAVTVGVLRGDRLLGQVDLGTRARIVLE
jgi:poly-gamma-glutamate capsule biosynthesis protein CapA/YwtB (metallophosphatase superfamily)